MANRRVILSAIFEDEWYGPLSFFEQQLWIGLFARCADDQGRLQDNPIVIRAQVFPYKEIPPKEIEDALAKFFASGKIIRYEIAGKKLIQLKRWWENQRPQWAGPSKWPSPEGWTDRIRTRRNNEYIVENWPSSAKQAPKQVPEQAPKQAPTGISGGHVPVPVPVPEAAAAKTAETMRYCEAMFGLNDINRGRVVDMQEEHGADKTLYAFKEAFDHNAKNWKYIQTILDNPSAGPRASPDEPSQADREAAQAKLEAMELVIPLFDPVPEKHEQPRPAPT